MTIGRTTSIMSSPAPSAHVRRAVPSAQIYDGSLGEDPTPAHEADLLLQLLFRCILDKLIWYAAVVGERFHVMTDEDGHFEYAEF